MMQDFHLLDQSIYYDLIIYNYTTPDVFIW
jgi:hypothetical protein